MNRRFKAHNLAKETGTRESWDEYKKLRNEVTYLLTPDEANYWKEKAVRQQQIKQGLLDAGRKINQ